MFSLEGLMRETILLFKFFYNELLNIYLHKIYSLVFKLVEVAGIKTIIDATWQMKLYKIGFNYIKSKRTSFSSFLVHYELKGYF